MSVLVFDNDTLSMIRYIFAIQHFNEYLVGPQGLSEYICALSLEKVLIQTGLKFPKFQKENLRELRVNDVVRFLHKKKLISPTIADKLSEYVDFHDSLMHIGVQTTPPKKADPKAQEILQFLCTEAGINQDEELNNRTFEEITTLRTEQTTEEEKSYELIESDFDNFDKLYKKCPLIQKEIEKGLTTPLERAQISGFTPNTGGIWLPYTTLKTPKKRGAMDRASVGVAFTPIDIRIGLNFGSYAHKYKLKYYELLLNGELINEIEALNRKATGYCFCDTFWHYHIRNIQSLQWSLTLYSATKAAIEKAIEETKQLEGSPLTANRYLISKVIKRRPEDFAYLTKGLGDEISKDLDELYPIIACIDKI